MSDFDYKKYSLEKLQEWVHDAMSGDASPHEIYSAIREAVRKDYYYHKDRISRASGLLELLSGHRPVNLEDEVQKWVLPVEVDDANGEYFVTFPDDLLEKVGWKEGDTVEYVPSENGFYVMRKVNVNK
jgi:hypothetical protein